jgi:hypothetical protein
MIDAIGILLSSLGTAAGKTSVNHAVKILQQLIGLQQEQVRLLEAINLKIDAVLAGPMNTGVRQLQDALSVGNIPERQALLKEARSSFTSALGQDPEPLRRSFAALYLASVWLLLGYPEHFKRHLQEAHFEAFRTIIAIGHPRSRQDRLAYLRFWYEDFSGAWFRFFKTPPIERYANDIAQVRRAWGTPLEQAPRFENLVPTEIKSSKNKRKLALQNNQQSDDLYFWEIESWLRIHARDEP